MKRSKKMLLLLTMLIVVCGGYFLLSCNQEETATVNETKGSFAITDKTTEDVTGLEWTSDGTDWHFTQTEGTWMNADNAAFPVNQSKLNTLADIVGSLTATRELTDVTEPENYGLSEPDFTVTVQFADGSRTTLSQGDKTPFGDGYYVQASDRTNIIYTVESTLSGSFDKSLSDLAVKETIPTADMITRLTVGNTLDIAYVEESQTINASQHWYDSVTGEALDTDKTESLMATVNGLSWQTLEAVSASDDQLEAYGLTDETAVIVTAYDTQGNVALTLYLGNTDASGRTYARLKDSAMVYTLSKADASALSGADADQLWLEEIVAVALEDVQEVSFVAEGINVTLAPVATESEEADASSLTDKENDLWNRLTALSAKEVSAQESGNEQALLSVSILMTDEKKAELVFSTYDVDSYILSMTGHPTVLVSASDVDTLLRVLRTVE